MAVLSVIPEEVMGMVTKHPGKKEEVR